VHQIDEHLLELALVALHEHGVLERLLAELLNLLEISRSTFSFSTRRPRLPLKASATRFLGWGGAHDLISETTDLN